MLGGLAPGGMLAASSASANTLRPVSLSGRADPTVAAWQTKPSWYVVATEDGAIAPELLRSTARRIGAETTEVPGSRVVFLTQPKAVVDVIEEPAQGAAGVRHKVPLARELTAAE